MRLSVIIPVYNEEATVRELLRRLVRIAQVKEIVVVDDFSKDRSVKEITRIKDPRIHLIRHKYNQGKGAAIRTGLKQVRGDHVLIQDADLEYDPAQIPDLIKPIMQGKTTVVFGSRFMGPRTNMFYWHYVGNRFLNFVINILYNSILTDMETCYKLIPTQLLRSLKIKENDFRIEPEITCKLLILKATIMEIPISFVARTYQEGKKITWKDGFSAIWVILKLRIWKP